MVLYLALRVRPQVMTVVSGAAVQDTGLRAATPGFILTVQLSKVSRKRARNPRKKTGSSPIAGPGLVSKSASMIVMSS